MQIQHPLNKGDHFVMLSDIIRVIKVDCTDGKLFKLGKFDLGENPPCFARDETVEMSEVSAVKKAEKVLYLMSCIAFGGYAKYASAEPYTFIVDAGENAIGGLTQEEFRGLIIDFEGKPDHFIGTQVICAFGTTKSTCLRCDPVSAKVAAFPEHNVRGLFACALVEQSSAQVAFSFGGHTHPDSLVVYTSVPAAQLIYLSKWREGGGSDRYLRAKGIVCSVKDMSLLDSGLYLGGVLQHKGFFDIVAAGMQVKEFNKVTGLVW